MNFIFNKKHTALLGAVMAFSLSACTYKADDRTVTGTEVGKIVVFSPLSTKEIASISFNQRFIDALPPQHQLSQAICAGDYVIEARSIKSNQAALEKTKTPVTQQRKIQKMEPVVHPEATPVLAKLNVALHKDQVQYVALTQNKRKQWELKSVSQADFDKYSALPVVNSKFIRRLSDNMVQCAK